MTYGQQNTLEEAHQQLDYAIAHGINFIDTAEMYPVPSRAETFALTETYLGKWLTQQQRDQIMLATKIIGPSRGFKWVRDGAPKVDRKNISKAVEDSLKRLQTDYIDLYQIHWPDRHVPLFGQTHFDPDQERETVAIADQLAALAELVQAGKIRYVGVSNETPWGVCEFCHVAKQMGLPQIISIQNAYNLLNRIFEYGLAEACFRHQVGLLAYSPLGFGTLTGKYLQSQPEKTRLSLFPGFGNRYRKPYINDAVRDYVAIAQKYNLKPGVMAIAFVLQRWFVTSVIIGATTLEQLKENLEAVQTSLDESLLTEIEATHIHFSNPAP
jgi:aryl-alcohol dehydrogenase (NADP+)